MERLVTKMLRNHKNQGFTLMEMLIVVAIIAILIAIAIPIFSASLERTKSSVCAANRRSLYSVSIYSAVMGEYDSPEEAFQAIYTEDPDNDYVCPSGGSYTWESVTQDTGRILCSYHEDGGQGSAPTPPAPTEPLDPKEAFSVGQYKLKVAAEIPTSGSIKIEKGKIYYYQGRYYCGKNPSTLSGQWALTHVDDSYDLVLVKTEGLVAYDQHANPGELALNSDGQLEVCIEKMYNSTRWALVDAEKIQ